MLDRFRIEGPIYYYFAANLFNMFPTTPVSSKSEGLNGFIFVLSKSKGGV